MVALVTRSRPRQAPRITKITIRTMSPVTKASEIRASAIVIVMVWFTTATVTMRNRPAPAKRTPVEAMEWTTLSRPIVPTETPMPTA